MTKRSKRALVAATLLTVLTASVAGVAQSQYYGPLALGSTFPQLDLEYVKGEAFDPASVQGDTITVIEFWATWCKPCLQTIPHLTDLKNEFGDKGLKIVGISAEDKPTVMPFIEEMGAKMDYTVAVDPGGQTSLRFMDGDAPIPRAFLFNEQGTLVWIGHPGEPDLTQLIWELTTELETKRNPQ